MNIIKIYNKYHLPENLQMHMLRVAACSNLIIDNWNGQEIDKESIIRVSLLHDMGNMVKIPEDFSKDEEFIKIRKKYFDKYGTNDHEINLEIGRQEGLTEKEIVILDEKRSRKNGVVGIKERLEDAKVRYKDKPLSVWSNEEKANNLIECSLGIEKQIMEHCKLKPEDINDNTIKAYIEKLKMYEI